MGRMINSTLAQEFDGSLNLREKMADYQAEFRVGVQKLSHKYVYTLLGDTEIVPNKYLKYNIYESEKFN